MDRDIPGWRKSVNAGHISRGPGGRGAGGLMRIVPRTRWGLIRMIALAGILPLLFLIIWLWTVRMPGPTFTGRLPPLTPNQDAMRVTLERHVRTLAHDIGVRSDETYANVQRAAAYIERNLQALGYQVVSLEFT